MGMIAFMKAPLAGVLLAGAAAVLPTAIVANLSAQSTPQAAVPTNSPDDFSEPATRPSQSAPGDTGSAGAVGAGRLFGGEGRNRVGQFGGRLEDPQAETQAAIAFFNENSPKRMAYFTKLPENSPARRFATLKLVQLYRPIQNFKDTNSKLYDLLVAQVKARDDAFEMAKDQKEADLREKAMEIVKISIQARHLRLDLLQKELANQQDNLAKYESNQDADAEEEATAIKNDEQHLVQRVERLQNRERGTSMLDFDPAADPLADAAPIVMKPAD
jgi:hypothetical protein